MTMPVLEVYFPVKSVARYGAQTGWPDTAWQKSMLWSWNASMLGVMAFA